MTIIAKRETSAGGRTVILLLPRICTGGGWSGKVEGEEAPERKTKKDREEEKERKRK